MYRWILLVISLILLASCSRAELAYRNADWLAYRWVDGLLNADRTQSERWPRLFEQVMQEHRRELLPQVVALLHEASAQADQGFSAEGLDCLWKDAQRLIEAHARLAVPAAVRVLGDISPDQVEQLGVAMKDRNAGYREAYLNPDPVEREAERVARYAARVERWTGGLSSAQENLVRASVRRMPDMSGEWLRYRERQQQRLLELLREGPDSRTLEGFLVAWWVDQADRGPALVDAYPRMRDGWIEMLAALDSTLDAQQRTRLKARIAELRDDLGSAIDGEVELVSSARTGLSCSVSL